MQAAIENNNEAASQRLARAATPLALLRESAAAYPDHPALVYLADAGGDRAQTVTYAQLLAETESVARALRAAGVGPDDGVAIFLPLVPQAVSSLIAATAVGVAFPMNLLLSAEAMASQLKLARVHTVITMGDHPALDVRARVDTAVSQVPEVRDVVVLPLAGGEDSATQWATFVTRGETAPLEEEAPERVAALIHTGGTTSTPKLAQLSQRNLAAGGIMAAAGFGFGAEERIVSGLPLFHVGGAVDVIMAAIAAGATVLFPTALGLRNPDVVAGFWPLLDKVRATAVGGVPTMLSAIAESPRNGSSLKTLRAFITGGAPLSTDLARRVESVSGRPVYQLYGMTETAGIACNQLIDGVVRPPSVGRPVPRAEGAIEEPGRALAPGQRGELFVRGPQVFAGYRTEHGTEQYPADGWVASGDLAVVEENGDIRIVGRTKEVIIRSGHNIDPLGVEEVAMTHPEVIEAAAIAMPDQYAGELPVLYVVLSGQHEEREALIGAFMAEHIGEPPARPKKVFILAEMPLTPLGKIARYRLRQMAAEHAAQAALAEIDPALRAECTEPTAKRVRLQGAPDADLDRVDDALARLGLQRE